MVPFADDFGTNDGIDSEAVVFSGLFIGHVDDLEKSDGFDSRDDAAENCVSFVGQWQGHERETANCACTSGERLARK